MIKTSRSFSWRVPVDNGPWQTARRDPQNSQFSRKLFSVDFNNLPAGEHKIVSRATDVNGVVQLEESALAEKKTNWENSGQFVRKFTL